MSQEETIAEKQIRADAENEESFIVADKNCNDKVVNQRELKSTQMPSNTQVQWWTPERPEGNVFKLGQYLKKIPIVFKLTLCSLSDSKEEIIGQCELHSDDLISLEDPVRTLVLHLQDSNSTAKDAYICLRTIFTASEGTLKRTGGSQLINLLCHEVIKTMQKTGEKISSSNRIPKWELDGDLSSLRANAAFFNKLFKNMEDTPHISYSIANQNPLIELFHLVTDAIALQEKNKLRPILEDDTIQYCRTLIQERIASYQNSLNDRNISLWENFIADIK